MISRESALDKYKNVIDRAARAVKGTRVGPATDLAALGFSSLAGAAYATDRYNLTWASGIAATVTYSIGERADFIREQEIEEYEEKIGMYEEAFKELDEDPFEYLNPDGADSGESSFDSHT